MDVDSPNILKRSSSAPLINEATTTATSPTISTAPRNSFFSMFSNTNSQRPRRSSFSAAPAAAGFINLNNSWGPKLTPRVNQLRAEEFADVRNTREVAHEREIHSAMQMGQSCEDLTLVPGTGMPHSPTRTPPPRFTQVSPSSTKRQQITRRSLSPVSIRPSTLSPVRCVPAKRRFDEADSPLSKRMCTDRLTPTTPGTPGTPDSDSLDCTFRPVSPRPQPMNESQDILDNHKSVSPS